MTLSHAILRDLIALADASGDAIEIREPIHADSTVIDASVVVDPQTGHRRAVSIVQHGADRWYTVEGSPRQCRDVDEAIDALGLSRYSDQAYDE